MPSDSALLIGVNDYSAYDASAGRPPAASELAGSLNDVRAWLNLCRELGITNIRVLTSPALPSAEQTGADFREATAQELRDGVAWLAGQLGGEAPPDEAPVGLLMFSGHGDQTANEGLVVCPTDVTAADGELANVVSLAEIQRTLAATGAERNLTVVLDCCHDGGTTRVRGGRTTALRAVRPAALATRASRPRIGERMLCAATLGQPAFQAQFGADEPVAHGAFTWAFMTTKNRWLMTPQPGGETLELSLSYQRMRDATRDLLRALEFAQCPELDCAPGASALPLFHRGSTASVGETSATPNQSSPCKQCDPGFSDYRLYSFWQNSVKIADMVVPRVNDPSGTYFVGTEYWFMLSVPLARAATTVTMEDRAWTVSPPSRPLSFWMPQAATWYAGGPTATKLLVNASSTIGIQWLLTQLPSGSWSGSIIWSQSTPAPGTSYNALFAGPPSTQVFSIASTVPATLTYNAPVTAH